MTEIAAAVGHEFYHRFHGETVEPPHTHQDPSFADTSGTDAGAYLPPAGNILARLSHSVSTPTHRHAPVIDLLLTSARAADAGDPLPATGGKAPSWDHLVPDGEIAVSFEVARRQDPLFPLPFFIDDERWEPPPRRG
jgi:hypothetical protein